MLKRDVIRKELERRDTERRENDRLLKEKEVEARVELAKTLAKISSTLEHLHSGQTELKVIQKEAGSSFDKHILSDHKRYTDIIIEMNYLRGQNRYWYVIISIIGCIIAVSTVAATLLSLGNIGGVK